MKLGRYMKLACDMCGKKYTTEPVPIGRSIFCTVYGNFCTDWGQSPDAGCWPKSTKLREERIARDRGKPGNVEDYWKAFHAGERVSLLWDLLSTEQRATVSEEIKRLKQEFRDSSPFAFEVGDGLHPFGPDDSPFYVVCRMRHFPGNCIEDMYYISWDSPMNSGEDPQYEELLLIHDHPDYHQVRQDEVSVVCLKKRKRVRGTKLVTVAEMKKTKGEKL